MNEILKFIEATIYDKCDFKISDYRTEPESQEYGACQFELNGEKIRYRNAKITPKKVGQFVTFWKRNQNGITVPFNEADPFDFYVITVKKEARLGQFVFPKSTLITNGIISTSQKDGKRGFRVYPWWDTTTSKQAEKTQNWQLKYFYEISETTDFARVNELYSK